MTRKEMKEKVDKLCHVIVDFLNKQEKLIYINLIICEGCVKAEKCNGTYPPMENPNQGTVLIFRSDDDEEFQKYICILTAELISLSNKSESKLIGCPGINIRINPKEKCNSVFLEANDIDKISVEGLITEVRKHINSQSNKE